MFIQGRFHYHLELPQSENIISTHKCSRCRRELTQISDPGTDELEITEIRQIASKLGVICKKCKSHNLNLRAFIFVAPALIVFLIFIMYPVLETFRLSFYDKYGRDFVGFNNYLWAFKDPELRRGLLNNLGWLIVVPTLSTAFGLIIANLADRIWWGTIAKSIIFMPMAISFVGAGVIWKFIYDYRGPGDAQIGLLNAIVVSFGYEPQAWITIPIWNNLFLMAI